MKHLLLGCQRRRRAVSSSSSQDIALQNCMRCFTRLPMQPRMTPDTAGKLIREGILSCARIEVLGGEDYVSVIGEMIKDRKTGGVVYDAIIAKVAQLSQVDILITLNVSDFRRVWPDGAARIVPPQSVAVPQRRVW